MVMIIEYKTSSTAYVINSVINMSDVTLNDLTETQSFCESRGGYFKILKYKTI